ncbi:MAG TPA: protein kinase [Thermoanaerobaculia bacterium]|jgi:serine/threonine protein kinase/tetratricopeptide (TPR) repeat protein|nr:protein kinase [Thermoanaerobaculia bacterium]
MDIAPGDRIGRIRIDGLIGIGGMGEVYRGFDERLERAVAVKVIHADKRGAAMRGRFLREARLLSKLEHPNICRIYDVLERPDGDYLVLELVEGETLGQRIRRGLPGQEALRIALEVARVLEVAHARGIIHRDLKPDNVMITPAGEIKVLDFGLARVADDELAEGPPLDDVNFAVDDQAQTALLQPRLASDAATTDIDTTHPDRTGIGSLVGTLLYMSPEQASGRALTTSSDVYSLGIVLLQMLGLEQPYGEVGDSRELLQCVRRGAIIWREVADRHTMALLHRLTAIEPSRRPGAQQLSGQLQALLERPRAMRKRWIAAALLALILSGLLIAQRVRESRDVISSRTRIALLPFRNATGNKSLQWVEGGLMELVGGGLSSTRGASIVPSDETLRAMKSLGIARGATITPPQRARLLDHLGAEALIESTVLARDGGYTIRYAAAGRGGEETPREVTSSVVTMAAGQMARQIAQRLDPSLTRADVRTLRLSSDEFANMAYAIGEQERLAHGVKGAEKYYAVAAERDPDFARAKLRLADTRAMMGDVDSAAALFREVIADAQRRGDESTRADALARLANFEDDRSRFAEGKRHGNEALEIARRRGDTRVAIDAANAIGHAAWRTNDMAGAEASFGEARRMAVELGDLPLQAMLLNNLGLVAEQRKDRAGAERMYREALRIAERIDHREIEVTTLGNLASIRAGGGDPAAWAEVLRKQLALARQLGDRETEMIALINLAIALYSHGEEVAAIDATARAADIAAQMRAPRIEALARSNIATARTRRGELAEAKPQAEASMAILPAIAADVETASDIRLGYAYWLIRTGRLPEAERAIADAEHNFRVTSRSLEMRARLAYERGDYRTALALIEKGKALKEQWLTQDQRMLEAFTESARTGQRATNGFEASADAPSARS